MRNPGEQIDSKLKELLAKHEIECSPPHTTARLLDKLVSLVDPFGGVSERVRCWSVSTKTNVRSLDSRGGPYASFSTSLALEIPRLATVK